MTCHTRSSPCLGLCSFYESINPHVSSLPSKACGSASKWELEKQHSGCFTEKTKSKLLLTNIYKNDIQGTLFEFSFNLQSGGTRHLHCILTTLTQPLCTWVWNVLWHESELVLRIIMRNSPCCLVCLFQIYCPLYHVVYLLSITSSSPELSQTSRSTVPHKTVLTLTTVTTGGISRPPSLLTSWLQIQGFPLPTTLRTQESTVFRITVLL